MDKFKITPEIQSRIDNDFQCRRCNECCRRPGYVYLKEGEAERIAEYLKMPLYDFTDQHCEVIERRHLVLKKLANETCIFLNEEGCAIHPAKPDQCREFPYRWHTPASWDYCAGLRELRDKIDSNKEGLPDVS